MNLPVKRFHSCKRTTGGILIGSVSYRALQSEKRILYVTVANCLKHGQHKLLIAFSLIRDNIMVLLSPGLTSNRFLALVQSIYIDASSLHS